MAGTSSSAYRPIEAHPHPQSFQFRRFWGFWNASGPDLPLGSASSDMIRWSRVLLSHTMDAVPSY